MKKTKQTSIPLGASLVVLSSVFYASYGIWTKLMGDFFDGYTASAFRSVLVVAILFPIAVFSRKLEPLKLKKSWKPIAGMFLGSLFTWGPLYYAIQHAGIGISLTINYASMVIGLFFFGWLIGKEHLTRSKVISALLGFAGMGLIFSPDTSNLTKQALALALLSGVSIAITMISAKQQQYNATQSTLILWITSILANFAMAFTLKRSLPMPSWHIEWLYLVFFAVASVVASWALVSGMKLIDAGAAGILGLLEIVFAVIFGILFFDEQLKLVAAVGIGLILISAAIPYLQHYSNQKSSQIYHE